MDPCPLTTKYVCEIGKTDLILNNNTHLIDDYQVLERLKARSQCCGSGADAQRLRAFYAIEVMMLCSYRAFHRIAKMLEADELQERFDILMKPMQRSWSGLTTRLQVLAGVLDSVVLELTEMQLMAEKSVVWPMVTANLKDMKVIIGWTQTAIEHLRSSLRKDKINLQHIGKLMAQASMKEGFMFHELYDHGLRLANTDTTYPASLWNQIPESPASPSI